MSDLIEIETIKNKSKKKIKIKIYFQKIHVQLEIRKIGKIYN